jgi:hypothetical protein
VKCLGQPIHVTLLASDFFMGLFEEQRISGMFGRLTQCQTKDL